MTTEHDVQYETRSVKTVRGMENRTRAKLEKEGWEFVSQNQGTVRSELNFRRAKAKTPWKLIGIGGGVLAILIVTLLVFNGLNGQNAETSVAEPSPTASEGVPSNTPSAAPEPTVATEAPAIVEPLSDAEVLAFFEAFIAERKAADVTIAKSVTAVSFSDRTVKVTFDPAAVGMDQTTYDYGNAFAENYAEFISSPISFNVDPAPRVRVSMDKIVTLTADGTPRGEITTREVVEANELD